MRNRRNIRFELKVIHRHRAGTRTTRRVSELVFINGRPKAVLGWIDVGGMRTPIYMSELDPGKLRKSAAAKNTFYYNEVTIDPRYEDFAPVRTAGRAPYA